jgi:cation:H+ antiporter
MEYILFLLGLILLIGGAEALVRGASQLAVTAGISPLIVGLTVVAFGTSSPEIAVSIFSVFQPDAGANVAVGNVIGSNIFNILFILGLSAFVTPLAVDRKLVRIEVPIIIVLSVLIPLLGWDGSIDRLEGLLLVGGALGYTLFTVLQGRSETETDTTEDDHVPAIDTSGLESSVNFLLIIAGLAMLVLGSRWLVDGAVALAENFGVSELVISLTIISAGTSLPEVATSVLAGLRGQRDIAVGNVVGSCIFNLLVVLGLAGLIAPRGVPVDPAVLAFDVPVMIAASIACLPIFFTGYQIGRLEGLLFLSYYTAYIAYVILAASAHDALPMFSSVMLYFTVPATALILLVTTAHKIWRERR